MGFTVNFLDNQDVTVAALNAIDENLDATEQTAFAAGTYGVDALNQITANIIGAGVRKGYGNGCKVTVSGDTVKVADGMIFFGSGVTMTVDADGVSFDLADGYVYAEYSSGANAAEITLQSELPSEGDIVPLAQIAGGAVTDFRKWAMMKNPTGLPNYYETMEDTRITIGYKAGKVSNTIKLPAGVKKILWCYKGNVNTIVSAFLDFDEGKMLVPSSGVLADIDDFESHSTSYDRDYVVSDISLTDEGVLSFVAYRSTVTEENITADITLKLM